MSTADSKCPGVYRNLENLHNSTYTKLKIKVFQMGVILY